MWKRKDYLRHGRKVTNTARLGVLLHRARLQILDGRLLSIKQLHQHNLKLHQGHPQVQRHQPRCSFQSQQDVGLKEGCFVAFILSGLPFLYYEAIRVTIGVKRLLSKGFTRVNVRVTIVCLLISILGNCFHAHPDSTSAATCDTINNMAQNICTAARHGCLHLPATIMGCRLLQGASCGCPKSITE